MGAGSSLSAAGVPELVTKAKAKELLGRAFDEARFDAEASVDAGLGEAVVAKARFVQLVGEGPSASSGLIEWLSSLKIKTEDAEAYAAKMEEMGIDCVDDLQAVSLEELTSDLGMKKFHAKKVHKNAQDYGEVKDTTDERQKGADTNIGEIAVPEENKAASANGEETPQPVTSLSSPAAMPSSKSQPPEEEAGVVQSELQVPPEAEGNTAQETSEEKAKRTREQNEKARRETEEEVKKRWEQRPPQMRGMNLKQYTLWRQVSLSILARQEENSEKPLNKAEEKKEDLRDFARVALTLAELENYEWKEDDGHRHLLLGITVEGLIRFLERIKLIRWTREEDTITTNGITNHKYTARGTSYGAWVYNDYDRSKYSEAIGWVDKAWGPIKKHETFGLTNLLGYDIEEVIRDYLKEKGMAKYSVCELILSSDEFSDMRHCVGPAGWFVSHADSEAAMGDADGLCPNGTGRRGTLQMLGMCAVGHKDLRLDSSWTTDGKGFDFLWFDYTRYHAHPTASPADPRTLLSLRPNVREWSPDVVVALVRKLGRVVALLDNDMQFLRRSWCLFELFAAIAGKTELICQYKSGFASQAEKGLQKHPVQSVEAQCSSQDDKKLIDGYVSKLEGGHSDLDKKLTQAIKDSNKV